jgi:hypothetical protein
MSDESQTRINRGNEAAQILNAPLYREAMETVERQLFQGWKAAQTSELRNELWAMCRARELIEVFLAEIMQDGEIQKQHDAEQAAQPYLERVHDHFHPKQNA